MVCRRQLPVCAARRLYRGGHPDLQRHRRPGQQAGTVTITVINQVSTCLNMRSRPAATARSNAPFDTLAQAEAASGSQPHRVRLRRRQHVDRLRRRRLRDERRRAADRRARGPRARSRRRRPARQRHAAPGEPGRAPDADRDQRRRHRARRRQRGRAASTSTRRARGGGIAGAPATPAAARSTTSTSSTPAPPARSPGSSSTAPPARSTSPTSPSATNGATGVRLNNAGTVNFASAGDDLDHQRRRRASTPPGRRTWARARSTPSPSPAPATAA